MVIYLQKNTTKWLHDKVVSFVHKYINTYINQKTQSGDRAITQSYTVHKYHTGSDFKYNQSALLNLSMGDKQNDAVVVSPKL